MTFSRQPHITPFRLTHTDTYLRCRRAYVLLHVRIPTQPRQWSR
jgi:hypothetical protein